MSVSVDTSAARRRMAKRAAMVADAARVALRTASREAASQAQQTRAWQDRTGKTRASIQATSGSGFESKVVARGAAIFLEGGTGLYGPRGQSYPIPRTPLTGNRWLSWVSGGVRHFARQVMHPGIRATHFMHDAAERTRPTFVRAAAYEMKRAMRA